jgi:2-methylisocitrate lyase-like PEP mutase family enzyme
MRPVDAGPTDLTQRTPAWFAAISFLAAAIEPAAGAAVPAPVENGADADTGYGNPRTAERAARAFERTASS